MVQLQCKCDNLSGKMRQVLIIPDRSFLSISLLLTHSNYPSVYKINEA
jgi:hypothetical protein